MTEGYPLLAVPGHEMYQLAHIATFIADGMARARLARDRGARQAASIRVAGGRAALAAAAGRDPRDPLLSVRPIDSATFARATDCAQGGTRRADVVSLRGIGRETWAVIGHVPGLGPVGAEVGLKDLADAVREHILTQPTVELAPWCVTGSRPLSGTTGTGPIDLASFVEGLDPACDRDRAVARYLRGADSRTDAAIRGRFAGLDLDAPFVVAPPSAGGDVGGTRERAVAQAPSVKAPIVPSTSAGP